MNFPTETEMEREFARSTGHSDLPGWIRCSCDGSCGVDIPVTLRVGGDTAPPVIVRWPDHCPATKRVLHQPPEVSAADRWRAWYDAVNEATED